MNKPPFFAFFRHIGLFLSVCFCCKATASDPLPGTRLLTMEGDIASAMLDGVHRFLDRETDRSIEKRSRFWQLDFSSPQAYVESARTNRDKLAHILGVRDTRVLYSDPELVSTVSKSAEIAKGEGYSVLAIRWPLFGGIHGEGLLLEPLGKPVANIVAIPDADQTPEELCGLFGSPSESQFARRLAENGCRVVVPVLVNRAITHKKLSNREFVYRSGYELGRHVIGYEIQKVLAMVDWFEKREKNGTTANNYLPIGLYGWGEGGLLAFYAGALDTRIDAVCVSGYFGPRKELWKEPVFRNLFGLFERFGDAEIAALIAPRALVIEAARGPDFEIPPGTGAAPGKIQTSKLDEVLREYERFKRSISKASFSCPSQLVVSGQGTGPYGSAESLQALFKSLGILQAIKPSGKIPPMEKDPNFLLSRQNRQWQEMDAYNQTLLANSPGVRREFLQKLDTSSLNTFTQSQAGYRDYFYREIIGRFDHPILSPQPRTRMVCESNDWTGYEVVLDVWPDVLAYGLLLVPKSIKEGEKRPVVVCQHGLEGRPQHVIGQESYNYYKAFAAQLAQEGYVTFAPQNLYLFQDRFRSVQRKANPLKKSLFSIIVPQHQQITDWLKTLPFVDSKRIGFYGLSYGGKTAMRVPPLVNNYCLSICSADFNDWIWKNASTSSPYSYVWTGEYEIFEFDLGNTFNYSEMAALIAPRPFMVERGHFDGVAPDETVAYEFAKVRHLYQAKLGLMDRCRIEWFPGPHSINLQGTRQFLRQYLWGK